MATPPFSPPSIVIMKIGRHAGEELTDIIARKRAEESVAGHFYWGYGGTLCHPRTQVQPFARSMREHGGAPMAVFIASASRSAIATHHASEYSADQRNWQSLPAGITVTGSAFALVCRGLRQVNTQLDLSRYDVAIGPHQGQDLGEYLRSRTDKACATLVRDAALIGGPMVRVLYVAELVEPFAVVLR